MCCSRCLQLLRLASKGGGKHLIWHVSSNWFGRFVSGDVLRSGGADWIPASPLLDRKPLFKQLIDSPSSRERQFGSGLSGSLISELGAVFKGIAI
ncbi:hypothetical protein AB1Y20_000847 [Prymnesium parvum]|uniref:Uncharacterized protein n=1 Tax=Prymnesium parvum TaxID=97485 RepID=A0AB34K623_PRYPA